jgi:hypothetical protein
MSGRQLAAACHAGDPAQHANCVGYVSGIYDLQFAPTPPRGVCPPADFTPELLAQVVTAYADTHEDGPAPAAIGQAIVRFFPSSSFPASTASATWRSRCAARVPNHAWSGTKKPTSRTST